MERIQLSLKTIYKMLMSNDYPVYSDSVIPEKMRKGQTLMRFWQSMIAEEFCDGTCGSIIWKNDGKRNRYLSALCNRSGENRLYREYVRELADVSTEIVLLKQIKRFSDFLFLREYRHEIFLRRVKEMVRIWQQDDRFVPDAVLELVSQASSQNVLSSHGGKQEQLFQVGYLLTILMVYACAGEYMCDPALQPLLSNELSISALWNSRACVSDAVKPVEYLTVRCGILQDRLLPRHRFFGREEALFDIRELAAAQKKCMISGIGGVGKTELLRQLLSMCEQERLADKVAVVPYHGGLAESFVRTFANQKKMETEEAFRAILAMLRRNAEAGNTVLILIDDMNRSLEEDPDLKELSLLPCGVVLTSRRTSLEGFEVYKLEAPSVTTGTLIFRDNYGRLMTREDRELLRQALKNEDICHPLTLNLMARAAGSHEWSVAHLLEHLQNEGADLIWREEDRVLRIRQIYNQLYSLMNIPEQIRRIAELFTLLPPESYSLDFLGTVFPDIAGTESGEQLQRLVDGGWLESLSDGYAMHPLVAECLRRKVITEDRQQILLENLRNRMPVLQPVRYEIDLPPEESVRFGRILLHAAGFLSGSISGELMLALLNAASLQSLTKTAQRELFGQLTQWRKRCHQWNDLLQVAWCTVAANWDLLTKEECEPTFLGQKTKLTVPKSLFLDFCLQAGHSMVYAHQGQLAWDMLMEAQCEDAAPEQRAQAYFRMAGHCHVLGKPEEALRWCEMGVEYVRNTPECGTLAKINILHMLCSLYTQYRRKELAGALIQEMGPLFETADRPDLKSQYLDVVGLYEMTFGDPDKALRCMREANELYEECFGRDRNYYQQFNMMGHALYRMNRLEEAVEAYEISIDYARRTGDRRMLQSASNNISVALLKQQKPYEALHHLETAVSEGRKIGGLMFGESLRNTALAWGQLKNEEKELAYYEEAWPLLLEAYGFDHPRAEVVWKRMEELKTKG